MVTCKEDEINYHYGNNKKSKDFGKMYLSLSLPKGTETDWKSAFLQHQQLSEEIKFNTKEKEIKLSNNKKPKTQLSKVKNSSPENNHRHTRNNRLSV